MPGADCSGVLYSPAVVTASDGDPAGGVSVSRGGAGHTAAASHRRKEGWWYALVMQWYNDGNSEVGALSFKKGYLAHVGVDPKAGSMTRKDLSYKCSIGSMIQLDPIV